MSQIAINDFAKLLSIDIQDMPEECKRLINQADLRYEIIEGYEFNEIVLKVLKLIDSSKLSKVGTHRLNTWENGWKENLDNFVSSKYDLKELIPKYLTKREGDPLRLNFNYIKSYNASFEYDLNKVYRHYLFKKYLQNVDNIYEFGCGTGYNLIELVQMYPNKNLYAIDWSENALKIIHKLIKIFKYNIGAFKFNIFSPDKNLKIKENSAVITFGALEQIGNKYKKFTKYLIGQSPEICLNSEPIAELYNENLLIDYLAIKYHRKRKYLNNYLTYLKSLESKNEIEISKIQRVAFGNMLQEGYSFIVWRPL